MKFFIFLFFIICIIGRVEEIKAVGYSPSSLIFSLNKGEEQCKMITIDSDSEKIILSDKWTADKEVEWNVNLFNNNSDSSIHLTYPKTLENEKEAKVCIKGSKPGEYHGVLLLKEEQKGNSVIQVGIWIKAMVNEKSEKKSGFWTMTGNVIGSLVKNRNTYYILGIFAILIIAGVIFSLNKKRDPWKC